MINDYRSKIYDVCNIWSLIVPGITRKRRTRAALALEDTKRELEGGEKVVSGERRLHEAIEAGSWPREELLGRGLYVSGRLVTYRSRFWPVLFTRLTCGDQLRF